MGLSRKTAGEHRHVPDGRCNRAEGQLLTLPLRALLSSLHGLSTAFKALRCHRHWLCYVPTGTRRFSRLETRVSFFIYQLCFLLT